MAKTNEPADIEARSAKGGKKRRYTKYTRTHLKIRNLRFFIMWAALVALLVVGMIRIHAYFDRCLTELEAMQYTYVADEMAKIFTEKRFDELFEYETCDAEYLETRQDYVEYLNKLAGDALIEYTQTSSVNPREKRYLVTADGKAFAEFTLKETGKEYTYEIIPLIGYTDGDKYYEPGDIYINILQPVVYDYIIPSNATISVNGQTLGEEHAVGQDEELFFEGHLYKGVEGYKLRSYRFTCALGDPEVVVTGADGSDLTGVLQEVGQDTWKYEFAYQDEELKPMFENPAVEFVKQWCLFSTHNTKRANVTDLTLQGSSAYTFIQNYENTWITTADKYEFQNISTSNYAMIGDKVLTCEVFINYHTTSKRKVNDYPTRCRLYVVNTGKNWRVYDFELLSTTEQD